MNRPKPYPGTVFALDPKLLSASYLHFDNLINKFGPDRGKYLAALPGSQRYKKSIADELYRQLGPQSRNYLRARVRLLPQGGQLSPFFYPFEDLMLNEETFINAAEKALASSFVHYLLISNDNQELDLDPSDILTNEVRIHAVFGNQQNVTQDICKLLDPIIYIHDEIHYIDPYFSVTNNEYVPLWQKIFSQIRGHKVVHIHTSNDISSIDFSNSFREYLQNNVTVNLHVYERDRRIHDRLFVGIHGGWLCGRGIKLSSADEIVLDFTAIGAGPGGLEQRLNYLNDIPRKIYNYSADTILAY
jgi:hypothetical protein